MARRRRDKASGTQDHSLLPIMNIMLLLVPALLLAMEVARMGAIYVAPPRVGPGIAGTPPPPDMPMRVFVAEDGFLVAIGDGPSERIGLAKQGTAAGDPTSYDFAALEQRARRVKGVHPEGRLQLDAEGSIPLATMVATLDALRGSDCQPGRLAPGEAPGPECLYLDATIAPGTRIADPPAG
jgi:biopolymer transport protein ExbD